MSGSKRVHYNQMKVLTMYIISKQQLKKAILRKQKLIRITKNLFDSLSEIEKFSLEATYHYCVVPDKNLRMDIRDEYIVIELQ